MCAGVGEDYAGHVLDRAGVGIKRREVLRHSVDSEERARVDRRVDLFKSLGLLRIPQGLGAHKLVAFGPEEHVEEGERARVRRKARRRRRKHKAPTFDTTAPKRVRRKARSKAARVGSWAARVHARSLPVPAPPPTLDTTGTKTESPPPFSQGCYTKQAQMIRRERREGRSSTH